MSRDELIACATRLARLLWPLERPLVGFDLETTGLAKAYDRVIEIGAVKVTTDGTVTVWETFVNPERPIPAAVAKLTGITDAMVADAPVFDQRFALGLAAALSDVDVCGYNARFDLDFCAAQFERLAVPWRRDSLRVLDPLKLWSILEPRSLEDASERWRKRPHVGAHRAGVDAAVAMDALAGQLEQYPNVPRVVGELWRAMFPRDPNWIDEEGKFAWVDGEAHLMIGKHRGPMRLVERSYWRWMIGAAFTEEQKTIAKAALDGRFPSRAADAPNDLPF